MRVRWLAKTLLVSGAMACGSATQTTSTASGTEPPPTGAFGTTNTPSTPNDCAKVETVAQRAPVDVIVSVDQSGSMSDDIENIKHNINRLSEVLESTGLDYRVVMIGAVGTGAYKVCVPPPLGGPGCQSNGTKFRAVDAHIESTDTLDIILNTLEVTTGPTAWKDFLRPGALKAFVPITDDNAYATASEFDEKLLALSPSLFGTPDHRQYVFFPIVGAAAYPRESICGSNAENSGTTYLELAKLTKGKWFPICETDFAPLFQNIASGVAATLACELAIPKPPNGAEIDLDRVNVSISPSSGGLPNQVYQDSAHPCAHSDGWQFNADKTTILLCGVVCDGVKADPGAKVTVEFGCQTRIK